MAVKGSQVTVTTSATALETALAGQGASVLVRNRGSVAVYIGSSAVTTATGYQLDPGEAVSLEADDQNPLSVYGITAAVSAVCHVLQVCV